LALVGSLIFVTTIDAGESAIGNGVGDGEGLGDGEGVTVGEAVGVDVGEAFGLGVGDGSVDDGTASSAKICEERPMALGFAAKLTVVPETVPGPS
jgi:hypothetical protein